MQTSFMARLRVSEMEVAKRSGPPPWRTEGPAVTCRAFFLVAEGPSWLEPRSYASNIEIGYCQGVLLDELATRFHMVAHQRVEDLVGGDGVVDGDLQHAAVFRIHGGFPQLVGVHLTQPLVALDGMTTSGFAHHPFDGFLEVADGLLLLATLHIGAFFKQRLQLLAQISDGAVVVTGEQITVESHIAGMTVAEDFHLGQPQLAFLVFTQADAVFLAGTLFFL